MACTDAASITCTRPFADCLLPLLAGHANKSTSRLSVPFPTLLGAVACRSQACASDAQHCGLAGRQVHTDQVQRMRHFTCPPGQEMAAFERLRPNSWMLPAGCRRFFAVTSCMGCCVVGCWHTTCGEAFCTSNAGHLPVSFDLLVSLL